ncbi:MAG: hypothetical protein FJ109_14160 [Deltaproteobacteria bacterium]|nr:hypothetical protein [Deltaproteobacteria bacterium]
MRPETGWLVFFFPRRGQVVSWLIAWGSRLGRLLRFRVVPRRVPHHVEGVRRTMDGVYLYGADAHVGFIGRPAAERLAGLIQGRDYLVVALDTEGIRADITEAILALDGRPYEDWPDMLRVWRGGNRARGDRKVFCSEAWVRIYQHARQPWAEEMDADNTSPLDLMLAVLHLCGAERVANVDWRS